MPFIGRNFSGPFLALLWSWRRQLAASLELTGLKSRPMNAARWHAVIPRTRPYDAMLLQQVVDRLAE